MAVVQAAAAFWRRGNRGQNAEGESQGEDAAVDEPRAQEVDHLRIYDVGTNSVPRHGKWEGLAHVSKFLELREDVQKCIWWCNFQGFMKSSYKVVRRS